MELSREDSHKFDLLNKGRNGEEKVNSLKEKYILLKSVLFFSENFF